MPSHPPRLLLEGPPGAGKSTVAGRVVELLRNADVSVCGFITREVRAAGRRVGFVVEPVGGGPTVPLAHVAWTTGPRVGRYRVDVPAFERAVDQVLACAARRGRIVVVVDELGRMELASTVFVDAVGVLLEQPVALLATVHVHAHPVTDAMKARPDVQRVVVTPEDRDELPRLLTTRLLAWSAPG